MESKFVFESAPTVYSKLPLLVLAPSFAVFLFFIAAAYASKLALLCLKMNVFFSFIEVGDSAALNTDLAINACSFSYFFYLNFYLFSFFISSVNVGMIPKVFLVLTRCFLLLQPY